MPIKFSELESISYDNVDSFIGLQKDSQGRYYNKLIQKSSLTSNIDTQIKNILNAMYPLGSLYLAMKRMDKCPLELLGVGTWVRDAENRCIQGSGKYTPGASVEPGLPSVEHTHRISTTVDSNGSHTHTRGSMNITGTIQPIGGHHTQGSGTGAFVDNGYGGRCSADKDPASCRQMKFDASRNWIGETSLDGAHTHTLNGSTKSNTTVNAIYGKSDTVQPPAYIVDVWKRIG